MMFKLQHPANLVSRLFILEYMREIDTDKMYKKANKHQKKDLFYKFINEEDNTESVDINWEYCLFQATLPQLEHFIKDFMPDIKLIEEKREAFYKQQIKEQAEYEAAQPIDINVMDMAQTEINKNKASGFQLN